LQQGTTFEPAFEKAYGAAPADLLSPWSVKAAKRGR